MRKIINCLKKIILVIAISVLFFACEIGLGEKVDIIAPTLKVTSPENTGFILQTFTIQGSAEDDTAVSSLEINIEPLDNPTQNNSFKFRAVNNRWEKFNVSKNDWELYESSDTSITGDAKAYDWALTYTFDNSVANGTEFLITTQAFDESGNTSKTSKDERSVTVDMSEPIVSLIYPAVTKSYNDAKALYDSYTLCDNTVLQNLINGEFTINGSQKEEGKLVKLVIYLDEKTTSATTNLNENVLYTKEITGDNLRNWSTTIKLCETSGFEHDKKLIRIVTQSYDQAGNVQTVCHGWFTYWNDADIPWVVANFGGNSYSDGERQVVYPNCDLQGQSYDDDGIASLEINVYVGNETTPTKTQTIDLKDENYPKYKAWSVKSLSDSSYFRVEAQCKDKYGNVSVKEKRYMEVQDVNPPQIIIDTDCSQPMIGNAEGYITLNGKVIDDGGIKSLKLVRLKANSTSDVMIKYYSSTYSEWKKATPEGVIDVNGNKLWDLTSILTDIPSSDSLVRKAFQKSFNIFTDFGINGSTEKLNGQFFIIMAEDNGDTPKIDSFTYAGDITAPVLTIDKVQVYKIDDSEEESTEIEYLEKESIDFAYYNNNKLSKMLTPYNRNTTGTITDTIELSGTWSDNSTDVWNDKTKRGAMTITWEGVDVVLNVFDDGTWKTDRITPPDATTAVIAMEFRDYAGNISKANENFFVSSNDPELLRITTQENDGSYKAGEVIHIELEFNKSVKFSGGTTPTLTLNVPENGTKRTANYKNGNDSATHVFEYTIQAGDDISALDVTSINTNGNKWIATVNNKDFEVKNMSVSSLSAAKKISGSKLICIDTKAPALSSITSLTAQGAYNQGKDILIIAKFAEDIKIEDESKLSLTFNNSTVKTTSAKKSGSDSILFTYEVGANQNFSPLKVTDISYADAGLTDIAGNAYGKGGFTAKELTGVIVDTDVPGKPVVSGFTDGDYVYNPDGVTFTIINIATDADVKQYSVNGGSSWSNYTGAVNIKNNGTYTITAKVKDAAGNESPVATAKTVTIDAGNLITSVSSDLPNGTYTTGETIPIVLNFRKAVKVATGSTLTLNNTKTAEIRAAYIDAASTRLIYDYTVTDEDAEETGALNVSIISGTFTDADDRSVNDYIIGKIPNGKNLSDGSTLKVVINGPSVKSTSYNQTSKVLTIEFTGQIAKGNGNIEFAQNTEYRAPAVLSVEKFKNLNKVSSIEAFYSPGVIGSDEDGNPDTLEKYILNFDKNITHSEVIDAVKAAGANKVAVPVKSSFVTVENDKLYVTLKDTYELPVKGAEYDISIPSGVVVDMKSHSNIANTSKTLTENGVEDPVIRIEKKDETIGTISNNSATVTQPTTAQVKIECQTPGIIPTFKLWKQENDLEEYVKGGTINQVDATLEEDNSQTTLPLTLGSSDITKGYIYKIEAKSTSTSTPVYEYAYRSVYSLSNAPNENDDVTYNRDMYSQMWVRGGDFTSGGLQQETFPVSWQTTQFNKVRAMTNDSGTWYWVTWKVNVNAYIQPLRGDMPSDAKNNGPSVWTWGMQGPIPTGLENYILYPGQSLQINGATDYKYGNMSFYKKHCEYRNGDAVVKEMYQPLELAISDTNGNPPFTATIKDLNTEDSITATSFTKYEWYWSNNNSISGGTKINNATTNSLPADAVTTALRNRQAGDYYFYVVASNVNGDIKIWPASAIKYQKN